MAEGAETHHHQHPSSNSPPSTSDKSLPESQGFGRLSLVAASAAQSAANAVQAGRKELTSKVAEGGYDQKVNETVTVVASKTTEIGQKTWGIMRGVMAMATQKVEQLAKEGGGWNVDDWSRSESESESERNGNYQEFGHGNKGSSDREENSSGRAHNSMSSWDDWNESERKETSGGGGGGRTQTSESWGGWDDIKDDDGSDNYSQGSTNKSNNQIGKSDSLWMEGGFR